MDRLGRIFQERRGRARGLEHRFHRSLAGGTQASRPSPLPQLEHVSFGHRMKVLFFDLMLAALQVRDHARQFLHLSRRSFRSH